MNRAEFIEELQSNDIGFDESDDWIDIVHSSSFFLPDALTMPAQVKFSNKGSVFLPCLEKMAGDTLFVNRGEVWLTSLKRSVGDIVFFNEGIIFLNALETVQGNMRFKNKGSVYFPKGLQIPDNVHIDENQIGWI